MPMKSPFPINGTGSGDGRWLVEQEVAKRTAARLVATPAAQGAGLVHARRVETPQERKAS